MKLNVIAVPGVDPDPFFQDTDPGEKKRSSSGFATSLLCRHEGEGKRAMFNFDRPEIESRTIYEAPSSK